MDRRTFLARVGALGVVGTAGCGHQAQEFPATPFPDDGTSTPAETASPTTAESPDTADSDDTATETVTPAPDRPVIFVSPAEIEAIRAKVDADAEPWRTAYDRLVEAGDRALDANPKSVVDNGAPAGGDDPHRYGTDAPYQKKDGVYSEDINRHDYEIALDMKDWIRDAALSYAFTGEDEYARAAIDLLRHWFLDPETGMHPSANNFGPHTEGLRSQNSIEHYIFVPAMLYGAALVSGHPHWKESDGGSESDLSEWLRTFQSSLAEGARGGPEGDEIYKWWVTTRAATAVLIDDREAMGAAFEDWRTTALTDFEERGSFEYARKRSRGLYYSLSALNALTLCAEIARHQGVDLYGYAEDDAADPVLERAHDFHAQYVLDPTEWPWEELDGLDRNEREYGLVSFELAYSYREKEAYLEPLEKFGRPIEDWRVLGEPTLTHGNRFDLDLPEGSGTVESSRTVK